MRFVVFCCPRTGSSMVCKALNQHPQIACAGEVWPEKAKACHDDEQADWKGTIDQSCLECIFGKLDAAEEAHGKAAIGFKLICTDIHVDSHIWEQFESEAVRIVFLERNVEQSRRSLAKARETGVWHRSDGTDLDFQYQPVTTLRCRGNATFDFDRIVNAYNTIKAKMAKPDNHIIINYQQIIDDWPGLCHQLSDFLNVERIVLPQLLERLDNSSAQP